MSSPEANRGRAKMKWRIRATQLSVVAAVAAALVTGPAASSSASLDLTVRSLGGISCADSSFCVAVGSGSGQENRRHHQPVLERHDVADGPGALADAV